MGAVGRAGVRGGLGGLGAEPVSVPEASLAWAALVAGADAVRGTTPAAWAPA